MLHAHLPTPHAITCPAPCPATLLQDEAALRQVFSSWAAEHGRRFVARSVEDSRYEQFKRGLRRIVDINADTQKKWWAAPNQYTDLTFEEFQQQYTGAVKPPEVTEAPAGSGGSGGGARRLLQDAPTVVDWVAKKKVTPIKSQGAVSLGRSSVASSKLHCFLLWGLLAAAFQHTCGE